MSKQHSVIRADKIEYGYWLTFDALGGVRLSRNQPSLSPNERAMAVQTILPKSLFKLPQLRATIAVSEQGATEMQIDVSAAETALSHALGCAVVMTVQRPEGE